MTADALITSIVDEIGAAVTAALRTELPVPGTSAEPWKLAHCERRIDGAGQVGQVGAERAKAGELPWVRLDGGPLAFLPDDVEAFARARRLPKTHAGRRWPVGLDPAAEPRERKDAAAARAATGALVERARPQPG